MGLHSKNSLIRKLIREHLHLNKPFTQVDRILLTFGGVRKLSEAFTAVGKPRTKVQIYRWGYSRDKGGAGGIIPSSAMADLMAAARYAGILLTAEHLDPRPSFYDNARDLIIEAQAADETPV